MRLAGAATVLLVASTRPAAADVAALLQCRQLPMGEARGACLERESARLEEEVTGTTKATPGASSVVGPSSAVDKPAAPRTPAVAGTRPSVTDARPADGIPVTALRYEDGFPVFTLEDGEVWQSRERRTLTRSPQGDVVQFARTPFGMSVHFNHSFFALPVVQRRP